MNEETNVDGQNPNPQETETSQPTPTEAEIDYKVKFSESSKEALRLLEEKRNAEQTLRERDEEIERLKAQGVNYDGNQGNLYPGFENLGEEEQKNLLAFRDSIVNEVRGEFSKDPAISFAKESHNEQKWNNAFDKILSQYPELRDSKEDFKTKYFNRNNVPENIESILGDLSKVYLFDQARDIGAKEAFQRADRIEVERAKGGDKTPKSSKSLEDWMRIKDENPAQFAKLSKEFNEDMNTGKLK